MYSTNKDFADRSWLIGRSTCNIPHQDAKANCLTFIAVFVSIVLVSLIDFISL